ncbi:hypothetical protein ACIBCA_35210 [Kitasatospora sp. NPDC051170]|uniref:hypothetical protein n=1 Tax=Kitasatospora sp. NPDC051170 TaxID=3364056 RepID=UPI0037ABB86A
MDLPRTYNVLREADSEELILASDFSATTGRTVGGFGDLVPRLRTDLTVWETAPPPTGAELDMTAADHVDRWAADVRASGRPVRAILGYCVGSVFAAGLAERIADWQPAAPRVIVFDPEHPHAPLLHRHYGDALGVMASLMSAEDLATARRAGDEALKLQTGGGGDGDLAALAATLSGLVLDHGDRAFAQAGLDAARRAELLGTFRSFLYYLVCASQLDAGPVWRTATAITSLSPHNGLNSLAPDHRDGVVAEEIRFDLPHADLLRDAGVARAVDVLLS